MKKESYNQREDDAEIVYGRGITFGERAKELEEIMEREIIKQEMIKIDYARERLGNNATDSDIDEQVELIDRHSSSNLSDLNYLKKSSEKLRDKKIKSLNRKSKSVSKLEKEILSEQMEINAIEFNMRKVERELRDRKRR